MPLQWRTLSALKSASNYTELPFISAAAATALAITKTIEETKIDDLHILLLSHRAIDIVINAYDLCLRQGHDPIAQVVREDARRLVNVLVVIEENCKKIPKARLSRFMKGKKNFASKMNQEFDSLANFQNMDTEVTGVSESADSKGSTPEISQVAHDAPSPPAGKTSASPDSKPVPIGEPALFLERDSAPLPASPYPPSSNSNSLPTARINAVGSRIATVYNSGNTRTTSKIHRSSTQTKPAILENITDTVRSEPRVTAYADHVLVSDSGNDVNGTQTTHSRDTPGVNTNEVILEHLKMASSQNEFHDSGV